MRVLQNEPTFYLGGLRVAHPYAQAGGLGIDLLQKSAGLF
jgi:hypothetical protein